MPGVVTTQQILAFGAVALILIAVPGPSVLFVVSRGLAMGPGAAVATAVGNEIGLLLQGTAVALGLGAAVAESILVFTVVKLVGAAYLIYLGVQAIRHRRSLGTDPTRAGQAMSALRVVTQGTVVGASNPKGFLILAAVLPQFVDVGAGHVVQQMFALSLVCVTIALVTDSLWGLAAGTARAWFIDSPRRLERVRGGAGVVMVGLGVRLALTGRHD